MKTKSKVKVFKDIKLKTKIGFPTHKGIISRWVVNLFIRKYVNLVKSKVIHNGSKSTNTNWGKDKSR